MEALGWIVSAGSNVREETQLKDEVDRLRATLPKARIFISRGEWGRFKNKELAELLSQLKDSTYDAEDLLRELDDQELRQKIEDAGRTRAHQVLCFSLNLAINFIHGKKTRVKEAQNKLDNAMAAIEGMLNLLGLNVESVQLMPETNSIITAPQVFGRDKERDALLEVLIGRMDKIDEVVKQMGVVVPSRSAGSKGPAPAGASTSRPKRLKPDCGRIGLPQTSCISNVSVLTIYGIGGMGKTTLAQLIYNDPSVTNSFQKKIWVCVSDLFDQTRITKEIIESISEACTQSSSLNYLQEKLRMLMESEHCPKFLLVLDDIWPNANDQWEKFYAPLRTGPEGSMILVTTRYPMVANLVTTRNCEPVELKGLPADIFWDFFRKCAFGRNHPEEYPILQDIGRSISSRLCGSPLAAKTLGRLLSMELTERHWRAIQDSELWELPHRDNEILPALQLSYLYLPQDLKRCFAFCSMFPKDYSFRRREIINIWVAEGFVASRGLMRLEDMGSIYLDELRNRFLLQYDPKSPQTSYVMHDLIHDMAQSISVDECLLVQDLSFQNQRIMRDSVRHMSVEVSNESLSIMRDSRYLNKLRSLRLTTKMGIEVTWFHQLTNILFLSLRGCNLIKLPESVGELCSLRYLDMPHIPIQELPDKFWRLYSLQVLHASYSSREEIHQGITNLINLRRLALPEQAFQALSRTSGLGNLSCLQDLSHFKIGRDNGRRIVELKGMNQISGKLSIISLNIVRSAEEAAEARLFDKQYIKELILDWDDSEDPNKMGQLRSCQNDVVEGLRPHPRIERLKINGFCGDRFYTTWFRREDLPALRSLKLHKCLYLKCLSIPCIASLEELELNDVGIECLITLDGIHAGSTGNLTTQNLGSSNAPYAFTRLSALRISGCNKLTNLDQFLSPENLPSVKFIWLGNCENLMSIPVQSFVGFVYLQNLKIYGCDKLVCPREMVLPSSLETLYLAACGELDRSFASCLENLTSLTSLQLLHCHNIRVLPLNSIACPKSLVLLYCLELSSLGASHMQSLSSIEHAHISNCPKLTEVEQPFKK